MVQSVKQKQEDNLNETIVAKGLAKYLAEKYGEDNTNELFVMNKAQTKEHGYTSNCATILWEGGPYDEYGAPWTYDSNQELLDWVKEKYGRDYWLEAYSSWMLCVNKG